MSIEYDILHSILAINPKAEVIVKENNVKKIIKEAMVSVSSSEHHMFSIPLEVSINSGNNWGEAH